MTDRSHNPSETPIVGRQGLRFDGAEPDSLRAALDAAVDYRGDVTVIRRSTGERVAGYVFDHADAHPQGPVLRLLPQDGGSRITIPLADVAALEFSGRDTAAGKSFESWVRRYLEKRLAAEQAGGADPVADPDAVAVTVTDAAQEPSRVGRVEPEGSRNSEDRPGRGDLSAQDSPGR